MAEKILIVEDDSNIRHLVSYKLKTSGYDVVLATNGAEALEQIAQTTVDLILLDIMMPVMSGKELLVKLKATNSTKHIPVVLLTAQSLEKEVIEGLSLGAEDYIKKPFSPPELLARVRTVLMRRNRTA